MVLQVLQNLVVSGCRLLEGNRVDLAHQLLCVGHAAERGESKGQQAGEAAA